MGITFFVLSSIPLLPFVFGSGLAPLVISLAVALVGLAGLGIAKARLAKLKKTVSAIELVLIGSGSAMVGYGLGLLASRVFDLGV